MSLNRRQLLAMHLAGTVSFPPCLPDLASISLIASECVPRKRDACCEWVRAVQFITCKLTVIRTASLQDVRAMFVPHDPCCVDFECGHWLLGQEVSDFLHDKACDGESAVSGILYVQEDAQTLLQAEVGMTAAESAEYYPPLGDDRSVDHYRFDGKRALHEPC